MEQNGHPHLAMMDRIILQHVLLIKIPTSTNVHAMMEPSLRHTEEEDVGAGAVDVNAVNSTGTYLEINVDRNKYQGYSVF